MHVVIVSETMPEIHPLFTEWLRSRKYPLKSYVNKGGKQVLFNEGTHSPFVREIKFYDICVKQACKDYLLSDLRNFAWTGYADSNKPYPEEWQPSPAHFTNKKLNKFLWILSKVTPLKKMDMTKIEPTPVDKLGWHDNKFFYLNVLGYMDDPIDRYGEDGL